MTILVTGATGNVGRNVVRRLVARGHDVRALTRGARAGAFPDGVRVHEGDLTRPETLKDALEGVDALFLFPVAATAEEVVGMARTAGVRRIVVLSSGAVTTGFDTDFHLPVEQAVEAPVTRTTRSLSMASIVRDVLSRGVKVFCYGEAMPRPAERLSPPGP